MEQVPLNNSLGVKQKSIWSFLGIIIVIAILIVSALYSWGKKLNQEDALKDGAVEQTN